MRWYNHRIISIITCSSLFLIWTYIVHELFCIHLLHANTRYNKQLLESIVYGIIICIYRVWFVAWHNMYDMICWLFHEHESMSCNNISINHTNHINHNPSTTMLSYLSSRYTTYIICVCNCMCIYIWYYENNTHTNLWTAKNILWMILFIQNKTICWF